MWRATGLARRQRQPALLRTTGSARRPRPPDAVAVDLPGASVVAGGRSGGRLVRRVGAVANSPGASDAAGAVAGDWPGASAAAAGAVAGDRDWPGAGVDRGRRCGSPSRSGRKTASFVGDSQYGG